MKFLLPLSISAASLILLTESRSTVAQPAQPAQGATLSSPAEVRAKFDRDLNGRLNAEEREVLRREAMSERLMRKARADIQPPNLVRVEFTVFDKDGDGKLYGSENRIANVVKMEIEDRKWSRLRNADTDADGKLSAMELRTLRRQRDDEPETK